MTSIIIDKRYCGPPNSGNGGYVCGWLARHIPGGAEVTLRAPSPLDKQLDVVATDDGLWELRDGATVVATGRPASVKLTRLEKASFDEACAAERLVRQGCFAEQTVHFSPRATARKDLKLKVHGAKTAP